MNSINTTTKMLCLSFFV